ncbi:hypothetical protein BaRGS_00037189 [Batillaria attramentaria]|uniref:Uncharacterized protein n=1 Tax=Batillaria attramentaria TaxID=370345 RepID=A0ABD0J9R0_9CAEN
MLLTKSCRGGTVVTTDPTGKTGFSQPNILPLQANKKNPQSPRSQNGSSVDSDSLFVDPDSARPASNIAAGLTLRFSDHHRPCLGGSPRPRSVDPADGILNNSRPIFAAVSLKIVSSVSLPANVLSSTTVVPSPLRQSEGVVHTGRVTAESCCSAGPVGELIKRRSGAKDPQGN